MVDWDYFKKFNEVDEKYLPPQGEGETMATQIATAVAKLVYKWYNDGDVYDNTHHMRGWCNDLSSYANWLYKYIPATRPILNRIEGCMDEPTYEDILAELCDLLETPERMAERDTHPKIGSVYEEDGPFEFVEYSDEDEYDEDEEDW